MQPLCLAPLSQLHRADRHGHPAEPRGTRDPVRHLRLYYAQVPLLPRQPARLAELHPAQLVAQQLLRQGEPLPRPPLALDPHVSPLILGDKGGGVSPPALRQVPC